MSSPVPWNDAKAKILAADFGVPIEWPNVAFKQPTGDNLGVWLSVDSASSMIEPIEIGGGIWQEEGTLYVDVITPKNAGTDAARLLAKQITNLFRGLPPQPVVYLTSAIGNGRPSARDGLWWEIPVSVDWRYQDINS